MDGNEITEKVIGGAIKVHRALGPGLLESAYEACLMYELNNKVCMCGTRFLCLSGMKKF